MKNVFKSILAIGGCALAFNAFADSVIDEVWTCKLKEDKEIEDVMKANAEWVVHVNGATDVGEIKSGTVEPIVGEQDGFYFVDTYPSLAAWSAVEEYTNSDAGEAAMKSITDQFDALFDCSKNELFKFTPN